MIQKVHPDSVPPPSGPYSPGIRVGNLLFLAGQGPFDGGFDVEIDAVVYVPGADAD